MRTRNGPKMKNVTFSMPIEVWADLHRSVGKNRLSQFAVIAIKEALEKKHEALKAEYAEANNDPGRIESIKDWSVLEGEDWGE